MLTRWFAYVKGVAGRRRIADEADEELAFHLQQETEANIRRGMSPADARRAAVAALGGLASTTEAIRDVRWTTLDDLWRDVRHALRSLRATPAFTLVALAVLTLSIGASTAMFSVVDGVVLRGLPFPAADRLVFVGERWIRGAKAQDENLVAPQQYLDWRAQQQVFSGLAAIGYASVSLKAEPGQEPETLVSQMVTSEFFPVLGAAPIVGRTFTTDNERDGHARVAVISYGLWQRRFGGAPDVVGRYLHGVTADIEILGVMPPGFAYPVGEPKPTEVWLPNVFPPEDRTRRNSFGYRLRVLGRLRDGVSIGQAQAQMDQITARLKAETPRWFEDRVAHVEPLHEYMTRGVRQWMLMLLAAVGFVLLIACVNLATLMLVRASARGRELVIRSALGASRWDLARGLIVESLLLSIGGALLGAFVAWLGVETLQSVIPASVPRIAAITVDLRVLAITMVAAVVSGLLFSLAPIVQLSRTGPGGGGAPTLTHVMRTNTATPTHQWLRSGLVVIEVALAVVLLVGTGLFLASFARVTSVPLGLDPRGVLTVRVRPLVYERDLVMVRRRHPVLMRNILEQVRAMPGVEMAAFVGAGLPLRGDLRTMDFGIPGRVFPKNTDLDFNDITPDYFRAMRVPLLAGRFFTDADREGSEPVAIINDAAARRFFPNEDPLGKTIEFVGTRRIVGIVGSIRHDGPETDWRRQGFVPLEQTRPAGATLILRLSRDPQAVVPAVKAAIWSQFPGIPVPDVDTLSTYLDQLVAQRRFNMLLLTLFGLLGIVIACVGIYGVMAYVVALRTHEIGVRMALGALPAGVLWSVLRRAVLYLIGGLVIGLPCAWMLSALVSGFLFQVEPHDLWVYASVIVTLLATGVAAAFLPARRAARVDPLVALRSE